MPSQKPNLLEILREQQGHNAIKKDEKDFKYIIYARKSTDSKEHQEKSLPDQVKACKLLADSKELHYLKSEIIEEKESAREPDIRPMFRRMMDDIKSGKHDGIITWHPDRLARNMKEAGEIIDLLDKKIIQDIKFASVTFDNDSNGKMMLGISFVLSKQYSDKLSTDIRRGIENRVAEGQYLSRTKHGYYKDRYNFLRPDGNNFALMKQAWQMRLNGQKIEDIAAFLNKQGYQQAGEAGKTHTPFTWNVKKLAERFHDTIYAGVLKYGKDSVSLIEEYDFIPMVTEEEFLAINKTQYIGNPFRSRYKVGSRKQTRADFLRRMVFCSSCKKPMATGITSKKDQKGDETNYFYFRCDNKKCKQKGKSVRGKVLEDFVIDFLDKNKIASKSIYETYVRDMENHLRQEQQAILGQEKTLAKKLVQAKELMKKTKELMLDNKDASLREELTGDYKQYQGEAEGLDDELQAIQRVKKEGKDEIMDYKTFLELIEKVPEILRQTTTLKGKDSIIREIFMNFTVDRRKVLSYKLKPPFDGFIKSGFNQTFTYGGVEGSRTPDLCNANAAL